jgi:hypothetical protein
MWPQTEEFLTVSNRSDAGPSMASSSGNILPQDNGTVMAVITHGQHQEQSRRAFEQRLHGNPSPILSDHNHIGDSHTTALLEQLVPIEANDSCSIHTVQAIEAALNLDTVHDSECASNDPLVESTKFGMSRSQFIERTPKKKLPEPILTDATSAVTAGKRRSALDIPTPAPDAANQDVGEGKSPPTSTELPEA